MRLFLRSCAVLGIVYTSILTILIGCTSQAPVHEADFDTRQSQSPPPAAEPSNNSVADPAEGRGPENDLPENASLFLDAGLSPDFDPVIVNEEVAAGWFHPPESGEMASDSGAMGLYLTSESLYLAYRAAAADDLNGSTNMSQIMPRSENRRVRTFEPVSLRVSSGGPNGFRVRFSGDSRDEEIFVLWRGHPENAPYTVRLPISAVRRTVLRDLTGDDIREMVQLSVIFDAMGNREIIVDALQWNSTSFVHIGSVSLIRAINQQLTRLEERLTSDADAQWTAAASTALQPIEESPLVEPLLPAEQVRIPRITELSIDLGRGEWHFFHDIAVEGNLYRLRIHLQANPLAPNPARIEGIQGL